MLFKYRSLLYKIVMLFKTHKIGADQKVMVSPNLSGYLMETCHHLSESQSLHFTFWSAPITQFLQYI
jgi:hypothetical protein